MASAQALLQDLPENRDLLLAAATSLRCLTRIDDALATLDRLEQTHPRFSRLHQERGLAYVALRDAPRSIESLLRAVNINPALPMSWRMLEGVYRLSGELENAATAAAHVRNTQNPAARGCDGDLAVFGWRSGPGRADRPRLPADAWRPSGGDAIAGQDWPRA